MAVSSPAFIDGETIPDVHSCFGENTSPALAWDGIPEDAQSLALIVDDPDSAPPGFIHWVIYNIPPEGAGLPGAVPGDAELADGSRQAQNDFAPYGAGAFPGGAEIKLVGYDGMCPGGEHRYVFTLYALDTLLDIPAGSLPADVKAALAGHILDQAQLIGRFAPPQ
ncbi:MAG: YbhB/YbcL family Raf kinase inhibitor-like protein [Anaerolineae bacterium]|nr:YbhB/YbcL family Raf kinase inhibitor-like protein [Anaerolineae bacterium]